MSESRSLRSSLLHVVLASVLALQVSLLHGQPAAPSAAQPPAAAGDLPASQCTAAPESPADADAAPEPDRVSPPADSRAKKAIKAVLASSEFTPEEKILMPVRKKKPQADEDDAAWMKKLESLLRAFSNLLRAGVWVLAALGLLLLAFTLHYWWRMAAQRTRILAVNVPTHVGGLDIRRESLPAHISAAARQRAESGDATGCLSLLYRGALSALVTHFACRILSSSTEDECVRRAKPHVPAAISAYFARLTQAWQLTVYAGRPPAIPLLVALCDEFDGHFLLPAPADAAVDGQRLAGAGAR